MKGIQFTTEEKQLVIEALLFSSITDVCAEWTRKHEKQMVDLAAKLNDTDTKLVNVYLFDEGVLNNPKLAEYTKKMFPNLPRNSIIID